jgi:hypothetical protein
MQLKKFLDFRSLSLTSALLGVLLIAIDSLGHYEGLPKNIIAIGEVLAFILVFFGLFNSAKASEENIIDKFKEFAGSKFGGTVLVGILTYLAQNIPDNPDAPTVYVIAAKAVGAILTVLLGTSATRELFVKARMDNTPLAPKYQVYAEK